MKITLEPMIASRPSRIGFVPATNISVNVVMPIKAVVPRSSKFVLSVGTAATPTPLSLM